MLLYTFFDIETTGLDYSCNSVLQFAYMEYDVERWLPVRAGSFYAKPYNSNWEESAEAVHHISKEFINEHGVDPTFAMQNIYALLHMQDVAGYNSKSFDLHFIQHEAEYLCGFSIFPHNQLDVMLYAQKVLGGKRRKLVTLTEELGIKPASVQAMTSAFFPATEVVNAHDARYDVMATALCAATLRKIEAERAAALAAQEKASAPTYGDFRLEV